MESNQEVELPERLHILSTKEYDLRSDTELWKLRILEYNLIAESPTPDEVFAVAEMALAELLHNMKKGAKRLPTRAEQPLWDKFEAIQNEYVTDLEITGYNKPIDASVRHFEPPKARPQIGSKKKRREDGE